MSKKDKLIQFLDKKFCEVYLRKEGQILYFSSNPIKEDRETFYEESINYLADEILSILENE